MTRRTPSERLLERLTAMGIELVAGQAIERTYAGPAQRRAGAWVWRLGPADGFGWVGSIYPVTELVRRPRLCAVYEGSTREWSVFPWDEREPDEPSPTYLIERGKTTCPGC